MHAFAQHLYSIFAHLGAAGLFLLGMMDSSFLMTPLGNDILLVGLASVHRDKLVYYVPAAALGSVVGCFLLDWVSRKGGEEGLKKTLPAQRFEYLRKKITERAGVALLVAALAPPPFPFSPVIAAAAAFAYPRPKLLSIILVARLIRYTLVGLLAVKFGKKILDIAQSPAFEACMVVFIAISAILSGYSVYRWVQRSRSRPA